MGFGGFICLDIELPTHKKKVSNGIQKTPLLSKDLDKLFLIENQKVAYFIHF
jgi:hypothetical protein